MCAAAVAKDTYRWITGDEDEKQNLAVQHLRINTLEANKIGNLHVRDRLTQAIYVYS